MNDIYYIYNYYYHHYYYYLLLVTIIIYYYYYYYYIIIRLPKVSIIATGLYQLVGSSWTVWPWIAMARPIHLSPLRRASP
jgi:sensor histidine kinase YesM